jgi:hypothetical protein
MITRVLICSTASSSCEAQQTALAQVSDEVKRTLGSQAQRELFRSAGPDGHTESLGIVERSMLHLRAWSHTNVVARAAGRVVPSLFASGCNCNAEQNDCYYSSHCTQDLNSCQHSGGCACDWIFFNCWTCDGVCNYDQQ